MGYLGSWRSCGCHSMRTTHLNSTAEPEQVLPDDSMVTALECPEERDKKLKVWNWPQNSPDPNLTKYLCNMPEEVLSMEAPPWIGLGSDPLRSGQGGSLDSCVLRGGALHGSNLLLQISKMLNPIGIFRIWQPGRHVELFVTFPGLRNPRYPSRTVTSPEILNCIHYTCLNTSCRADLIMFWLFRETVKFPASCRLWRSSTERWTNSSPQGSGSLQNEWVSFLIIRNINGEQSLECLSSCIISFICRCLLNQVNLCPLDLSNWQNCSTH